MKKKFSKHWKASSQPRKQRKYRANAPIHLRKKFVSINLSKELRKKEGKRNLPVIKNDKVKICRGKFKGKEGKVLEVNLKRAKIIVEGIQVKKMDGSKANVKMQPSNLQIIELVERKKKQIKENKKSEKKTIKKETKDKTKLEEKK
ncbi:MAG: 50S ribosomal protein L24 [Candidatus Diapherotrites archaeon]